MSVASNPLPPVPTHTIFLGQAGASKAKVGVEYSNWFNLLRTKINIIDSGIVALAGPYTVGDLFYADTTTTVAKLPVATNTWVLTLVAGLPVWAAPSGAQAAIQFKDEGVNVGASGAITSLDVVGAGGALTVVGTAATLTLSGGGGGSGYSNFRTTLLSLTSTTETTLASVSLPAGTYMGWAVATCFGTGGAQTPDFYITDGTNYYGSAAASMNASEIRCVTVIAASFVLTSTTTVEFRVTQQTANNVDYYAVSPRQSKAGATGLTLLKIA